MNLGVCCGIVVNVIGLLFIIDWCYYDVVIVGFDNVVDKVM